jgi:hypothetical protein
MTQEKKYITHINDTGLKMLNNTYSGSPHPAQTNKIKIINAYPRELKI